MMVKKGLYLVAALFPFVYGGLILVYSFSDSPMEALLDQMYWPAVGLIVGSLIVFLWHAKNNKRLSSREQKLWIAVLVIGSFFSMLVYYFIEIGPSVRGTPGNRLT